MPQYDWKNRLYPLLGTSFVVWLFMRPAHWPFASFQDSDNAFSRDFFNRMIWAAIVFCFAVVFDYLMVRFPSRHAKGESSDVDGQTVFWPVLFATLAAKISVGIAFASRPLPDGSTFLFGSEWRGNLIMLSVLLTAYLIGRKLGPLSQWPLVQAMVLKSPNSHSAERVTSIDEPQ